MQLGDVPVVRMIITRWISWLQKLGFSNMILYFFSLYANLIDPSCSEIKIDELYKFIWFMSYTL